MHRVIITGLAAVALILGSGDRHAQAAEIPVYGSTTVASALLDPQSREIERRSGQTLNVVAVGSGRGVEALVQGRVQIAMISAPLDAVVAKLNKSAPGSIDAKILVSHQVGVAQVAFVIHPSNPIKTLTFERIADIMAGKIRNWKQVGGPDLAIEVLAGSEGGGARTMVEKTLEAQGGRLMGATDVITATLAMSTTAGRPGAIGITARHMANNTVRLLETDRSIEQPLILVTKGLPGATQAKVIKAARSVAWEIGGGA